MRAFILFLALIISNIANANELTVDEYGNLPSRSLMAISPSGSKLAYRDTSNKKDLLIVIDATSKKLLTAARIEQLNPNNIYFISEEIVILVATKNIKLSGYRGRHDSSWAYAFNLKTNKIHQLLTQGYGIYDGQTQLGKIIGISPDKKYAYMPAWGYENRFNLYKVNLTKRKKPKVLQKGTSDTTDFFIDNQGNTLARERFNNKENLHTIESRIEGSWKKIYKEETSIRSKGFYGLTPDYQSLVFRSYDNETGHRAYYSMRLNDGHIGDALFKKENKSVEQLLNRLDRRVYGAKYSGFTPSYDFFEQKLNARLAGIKKALPDHSMTIQDYTPDWEQIIFYMEGEFSPGDYMKYNAGKISLLTPSRPEFPPEAVANVIEYEYEARDGLKIPTLLTLPNNKKIEHLPAILMPHGGPESHDRKGFNYMAQYFANQGYIVIQPQFRGSNGFGSDFILKGRGEWGKKMQDDLTDAITNLAKENKIDKNKVCIVGASYGGYAALAGSVFTPNLYKCVVSINGVSDVERMVKDEKRDFGRHHWVVAYWQDVISHGEFDEDHLETISPINFAKNVKAPVLLIHGERDEIVPLHQSENMLDELENHDKEVTFVELENGDHYLSKRENRIKAMQEISKFIKEHI